MISASRILVVLAIFFAAGPPSAAGKLTNEAIFGDGLLAAPPYGFAWSADGSRLAYMQRSGTDRVSRLRVRDVASGRTEEVLSGAEAFSWSPAGDALLLTLGGDLYVARPSPSGWKRVRLTSTAPAEFDAKFSPDGRRIGFVREDDLYVIDAGGGGQRRLTEGTAGEVLNGQVDWVYEEEFELSTGWWWSPDSTRIAYLQFDERAVSRYPIVDWVPTHPSVEWQHYPKAGDANPVVRLGVVDAGESDSPPETRWIDTGGGRETYIPRVAWSASGPRLAVQVLDRDQARLALMLCEPSTGRCRKMIEEADEHWINIDDSWWFLEQGERAGWVLWSSERDGWRHLYLHDGEGRLVKRLTSGPWAVTELSAVDEDGGWVYFMATREDPRQRHLYRVRLDGSELTRITRAGGWHTTWVDRTGRFVDRHSARTIPPAVSLRDSGSGEAVTLHEAGSGSLESYSLGPVEFRDVKARDGVTLPGVMILPPDFDPARKYPVLIYVYGGPHGQTVMQRWDSSRGLWHQMMAGEGYIIWSLDNRGTGGRGHGWETPLHRRLGSQELSDQLDGVAYLRSLPYVDPTRIGIWGWSYGGFVTLHAMINAADVFKTGVAVAPVTDWRNYDTVYTERYMETPAENETGYEESALLNRIDNLNAPLLIIHGTSDDNVHLQNSIQILDRLISGNRPVELMLYPGQRHGISANESRRHLFEKITRFLRDNL